jgi:hypothetical protein
MLNDLSMRGALIGTVPKILRGVVASRIGLLRSTAKMRSAVVDSLGYPPEDQTEEMRHWYRQNPISTFNDERVD